MGTGTRWSADESRFHLWLGLDFFPGHVGWSVIVAYAPSNKVLHEIEHADNDPVSAVAGFFEAVKEATDWIITDGLKILVDSRAIHGEDS